MRNINFMLSGTGVVLIPEALWDAISRLDHSQQQDIVRAWTAPYTATTPMSEYTAHQPKLTIPTALWNIVGWIHAAISNPIMELWASTHQQNCETCGWHTSGSGCGEPEFLRTKYVTCGEHERWKPKTTASFDIMEADMSAVEARVLAEQLKRQFPLYDVSPGVHDEIILRSTRVAEHIEIHLEVPDAFVDNRSLVEVLHAST